MVALCVVDAIVAEQTDGIRIGERARFADPLPNYAKTAGGQSFPMAH